MFRMEIILLIKHLPLRMVTKWYLKLLKMKSCYMSFITVLVLLIFLLHGFVLIKKNEVEMMLVLGIKERN